MKSFYALLAAGAVLFSLGTALAQEGGGQCKFELTAGRSVLPVDKKTELCLKVGVTGFETESEVSRPELNIALVIDKSGSMSGDRIRQAKEAAACAVNQMKESDIVSVVVYDSDVEVLVPATRLTAKKDVLAKIDSMARDNLHFIPCRKAADVLQAALLPAKKTAPIEMEKSTDAVAASTFIPTVNTQPQVRL